MEDMFSANDTSFNRADDCAFKAALHSSSYHNNKLNKEILKCKSGVIVHIIAFRHHISKCSCNEMPANLALLWPFALLLIFFVCFFFANDSVC